MRTDWESVGAKLRQSPRRKVAPTRDQREICEGCGVEVTRGTLRNVLVDRSLVAHQDPRTQQPVYRFEAYKALCSRCQREAS